MARELESDAWLSADAIAPSAVDRLNPHFVICGSVS